MDKIDIVLPWVDGNDLVWLAEKRKYERTNRLLSQLDDDSNSDCRYRDNGLLKYWFRGVEEFAPWVNRIHFITYGHKPDWLNTNHPKLKMVNHKDYIPSSWLPTFNARTINLNCHRISDLAEQFVLFDDDMFLLQPVNREFFFKGGMPVLTANLSYSTKLKYSSWGRVAFNNYCIVNEHFNMGKSIWENQKKWFNIKELGFKRSKINFLCYLANKTIPLSQWGHLAIPHLKSSFYEVWEQFPDIMEHTSFQKFRNDDQVNQWLLCAWNSAKGNFYPTYAERLGINFSVNLKAIGNVCELIKKQSVPQICVNDSYKINNKKDHDYCMKMIADAFESILPNKSAFEN